MKRQLYIKIKALLLISAFIVRPVFAQNGGMPPAGMASLYAGNDICDLAVELVLDGPCLPGDNQTALFSGTPPACVPPVSPGGGAQTSVTSLWYRYPALQSGWVKITTDATFNDVITLYEGSCANLSNELCSNRDEFGFTGETFHFQAVSGKNYFIRISGLKGDFGQEKGTLCIGLQSVPAPPSAPVNDLCQNAIQLTVGGGCQVGSNENATFSQPAPSLNQKSRADIWYRFTATTPQAEVISHADFSDVIALYSGNCGNLTEIAVNDFGQRLITAGLIPGEEYFIQVSGLFATVEGHVCPEVKPGLPLPPVNDDCLAAMPVVVGGGCMEINNLQANFNGPKPGCVVYASSDVWYSFMAPLSGKVRMNTGAGFPAAVAVYSGPCNNLTEIKCFSNPLPCEDYFEVNGLTAGEVYYVQVALTMDIFQSGVAGDLCLSIMDGTVPSPDPLSLFAVVNCVDDGAGALNVTASGGQEPYVFEGNVDGEILVNGENWLVVVRDAAGCEKSMSGTAQCGDMNCALVASISTTDISCLGMADGLAVVSTENATGVVSYLWSNGSQTNTAGNLPPGQISVTVMDEEGCVATAFDEITQPALLLAQPLVSPETVAGGNNGSATVILSGGTPPYACLWSNGSTTHVQNGLSPGTYTVTVTDARQCQVIVSAMVSAFNCDLSASLTTENVSCHGAHNGTASVLTTGGTWPVTFLWSNGNTTSSVSDLLPGFIAVTVTDSAGCTVTLDTAIYQPSQFTVTITSVGETSAGANDGTVVANPAGGLFPYTFLWSNGETADSLTGLTPEIYTVTVTDFNGCTTTASGIVNAFVCSVTGEVSQLGDVSCHGAGDGQATVAMQGGLWPFTYSWPDGGANATATGLGGGNYSVTVTDANQCSTIVNVFIEEPDSLNVALVSVSKVECDGDSTGVAVLEAEGGIAPYTYNWPDGFTGAIRDDLPVGSFLVGVVDSNFCTYYINVEIEKDDNVPPVVSVQDIVLFLDENGMATLTVADLDNGSYDNCGIAGYALNLTDFQCNDVGEHEVTLSITDVNGNVNTGVAIVTVVDTLPPDIQCPDDFYTNFCDPPVEYPIPVAMDNCQAGMPVLTEGLLSGVVFPQGVTVETFQTTDASGNQSSCSFTVTVDNIMPAGLEVEKPVCNGGTDGSATVLVTGGDGNYIFQWDDGQMQTTQTASGLTAGVYQVTVTDGTGCSITGQALITEPPALVITVQAVLHVSSQGGNDGSITVAVSGGAPPYTFEWYRTGAVVSTGQNLENAEAGSYLLKVIDANGCAAYSNVIKVETVVGAKETGQLEEQVLLFPNPASDYVTIQWQTDEWLFPTFEMFDISGRRIEGLQIKNKINSGYVLFDLDLRNVPCGLYELKVVTERGTLLKKVIILR